MKPRWARFGRPRRAPPIQKSSSLIESELGTSIDELFHTFEELPVASASIGQVHRAIVKLPAMLTQQQEVAVKVQHPGIVAALESDLANASILEQMMAIGGTRRFNSQGMLEMIRTRFREELDYRLEAERQRAFAKVHARRSDDPGSESARRAIQRSRPDQRVCARRFL
jgi:predicted unusual protein kinase regulating ubiquinone biosynthesis (AarF/ABC1/UbiB family)